MRGGAPSRARRPLGLAVVGGLLFSQALTLFVTPVFYVVMERLQGGGRRLAPAAAEPGAGSDSTSGRSAAAREA